MATSAPRKGELRREIFEDEHDAFRDSVRGFLLREAVPHTEEWEQAGLVDRSFWTKAAAQGYVAFAAPEDLGGAGIEDFRFNAIINEEVAYTGTVYDNFSLTNDIVAPLPARADDRGAACALAAGGHLGRVHRGRSP